MISDTLNKQLRICRPSRHPRMALAGMVLATAMVLVGVPALPSSAHGVGGDRAFADEIADDVVRQLYVMSDRHWHKGEYAHLVNMNRMVLAARPKFIEPYLDAGWLLWSMGRDKEAEALYDQGIAANPESYALYNEKGFYLLTRKKDIKGGLALLEQAVSKKDCAKIVLHTMAHAYEKNGQLDKALATWTRAASDPQNPGRAAARVNRDRVRRLVDGQ